MLARARDDAGDGDEILPRLTQLGQGDEIVDVLHARSERIERMRREIDPEQLLFPRELLLRGVHELAVRGRHEFHVQLAAHTELGEQTNLSTLPISLQPLRGLEDLIETIQLPEARPELVARARLDKGLDDALVRALEVESLAEVIL